MLFLKVSRSTLHISNHFVMFSFQLKLFYRLSKGKSASKLSLTLGGILPTSTILPEYKDCWICLKSFMGKKKVSNWERKLGWKIVGRPLLYLQLEDKTNCNTSDSKR